MKRNAEDGENAEEDAEPGRWGKPRVFSCFSAFLIKKCFILERKMGTTDFTD
jgi:hypothetical protein